MRCNRRTFFAAASGLALGARMAAASAQGANNRIRIGVIGTGGRARGLMGLLKRLPGNEMVALCDVYEPRLLQAGEIAGSTATKVADYRRILDDRDIDAVVIGAPDHWHKTIALDAVAAGKDVYVEKPVSHTIAEGAEMVRVIEASKQIVQTGTQQRSWDHWVLGKQIIDSGRLGQITFVQTYWYQHSTAGNYAPVSMDKLDWKQWLGPAKDQPFRPECFYQWRHFWDFGGGQVTDLMTHWIDVVHWYMDVDAPLSAAATGRNYNIKLWEAPDTVNVTLEFPKNFMAVYLGTLRQPRRRRRARVPWRPRHPQDRPLAAGVLPRRCRLRAGDEYAGAGHLRPLERRRHADPPAELARLHPQPQGAELAYPGRPSGGADVPHRQCRPAGGSSGALEQRGGEDGRTSSINTGGEV